MWAEEISDRGFAIAPEAVKEGEIELLIGALSASTVSRTKAGIRHVLGIEAISNLARKPRLIGLARVVLGADAMPFHATLFDKSLPANWLAVWHQDTALPLQEKCERAGWGPWSVKQDVIYAHAPAAAREKILALRVHIDESASENGPLKVLAGTHNSGVLSDDSIQELAARVPATDCVVLKGGILAMRPLVVHSSSKSQDSAPRRVLYIEYAASATISEGLKLATA